MVVLTRFLSRGRPRRRGTPTTRRRIRARRRRRRRRRRHRPPSSGVLVDPSSGSVEAFRGPRPGVDLGRHLDLFLRGKF